MFSGYFGIFLFMGIFGVGLESLLETIISGKFKYQGSKIFGGFPFLPMYAVGGVLVYLMFDLLANQPLGIIILTTTMVINGWEFLGGVLSLKIYKRRLWDYRKHPLNIGGHVSLLSFMWWTLLIILFYFLVY